MANLQDTKHNTFGSIAAIQTLVGEYPRLTKEDSLTKSIDMGTSLGYIIAILRIFGITETDIVNWLSKLLCGETIYNKDKGSGIEIATDGLLTGIEYAIKGVLLANIKDMFGGCPVSPIIPDRLMDDKSGDSQEGLSIKIPLIDSFGTLQANPCSDSGSIYYFDVNPNIYQESYKPNELYKSSDFNAFLWYIINKSGPEGVIWDNRVNVEKDLTSTYDEETKSYPLRDLFQDEKTLV